jgi:hypothetical protein
VRVLAVDLGSSSIKWACVMTDAQELESRGQVRLAKGSVEAVVQAAKEALAQAEAVSGAVEAIAFTGQTTSYVLCRAHGSALLGLFWYDLLRYGSVGAGLRALVRWMDAAGSSGLELWPLRDWVLRCIAGDAGGSCDVSEASAFWAAWGKSEPQCSYFARFASPVPGWSVRGTLPFAGRPTPVIAGVSDVVAEACYALSLGRWGLVRVGTSAVVGRVANAPPPGLDARWSAYELVRPWQLWHTGLPSGLTAFLPPAAGPLPQRPDGKVEIVYDAQSQAWHLRGLGADVTGEQLSVLAHHALVDELRRCMAQVDPAGELRWAVVGGGADRWTQELLRTALGGERCAASAHPGWEAALGVALWADPCRRAEILAALGVTDRR